MSSCQNGHFGPRDVSIKQPNSNLKSFQQVTEPRCFFGLPLEVRQLVYSEIFADSQVPTFGVMPNLTLHRARLASLRLRIEIDEWHVKRVSYIRFIVGPQMQNKPSGLIKYDKLDVIELVIDHYDLPQYEERDTEDEMKWKEQHAMHQIADIRHNLERVVGMLSDYEELPQIQVRFYDTPSRRPWIGDEHWCTPIEGGTSRVRDHLLKHIPGDSTQSIVDFLLEPLLALPLCDSAFVETLDGITEGLIQPQETELYHDAGYVYAYFDAFGRWLEGNRPEPFRDCWRRIGRTWTSRIWKFKYEDHGSEEE